MDDIDGFWHIPFTDQLPPILDEDLPCPLDDLQFDSMEISEEDKVNFKKVSRVVDVVLTRLLRFYLLIAENLKISQSLGDEEFNQNKMKLQIVKGLFLFRLIELIPEEEEDLFKVLYHFEMIDDSVLVFKSPLVTSTPPK